MTDALSPDTSSLEFLSLPPTLLITGASSGVGHSLVHHLQGRYTIIAVARRMETMREAFRAYPNVHPYALDLEDVAQIPEVVAKLEETHGPILQLINNAGVNVRASITDLPLEALQRSLSVNALAPFVLLQTLLKGMRGRGYGRVINVTSGAPLNCFAEYGAYSSSKAALNALTVTAAKEHADADIKINLMSPGPVRTEMAPDAPLEPSVCHATVDYLLNLNRDGPTGGFFWLEYTLPLFPDLSGVRWLEGQAPASFRRSDTAENHD